jgi:hypothetical protein
LRREQGVDAWRLAVAYRMAENGVTIRFVRHKPDLYRFAFFEVDRHGDDDYRQDEQQRHG